MLSISGLLRIFLVGGSLLPPFITNVFGGSDDEQQQRGAAGPSPAQSARAMSVPKKARFQGPHGFSDAASALSETASVQDDEPAALRPRFARPTLDTAFKHMLMDSEDPSTLISFLEAFTGLGIASVKLMSTALPVLKEEPKAKQCHLDLACKDKTGRHFIVEVQVKEQDFWDERALYYAAGVYSQQLSDVDDWRKLRPVVGINILDHDRKTLPDGKFRRDFQLLDRENIRLLKPGVQEDDPGQLPYIRLIQIELPRANLADLPPSSSLRQWLQLLKEAKRLQSIPEGLDDSVRKAYERLEFSKWGADLKKAYEGEVLDLANYQQVISRSKDEGREEKSREVALKLLELGRPVAEVAEVSGLPIEAVHAMKPEAVGQGTAD